MPTERPERLDPRRCVTAARLAACAVALRPSVGRTRLIVVDGIGGSGKTTFADTLAAHLPGAPVVRLDDFARPGDFFGWLPRLREQLLAPLARHEAARCDIYDWPAYRIGGYREIPAAPVVILEGVGAARRELDTVTALRILVDTPAEVAAARTLERDGPGLAWFWRLWRVAEAAHLAADRPWDRPHVRVDGTSGRLVPPGSPASPAEAVAGPG
ncbi:uridine kinase [Embleya sp. NPDC059237]|uniref:uridine kinase family protein n=1 Tax=Embleya sp. NPDC059237 TaxID=3346784 RepID=UPI00367BAE57